MVRQAPLGHDRAAARDDAGHPRRRQRHVRQSHAGVDGEVVDPLLGLFDQRVAEQLPGQLLGNASDLLQRLVDRHGPDRHRRVAEDPLAGLVDVLAGGEVHHRVATPAGGPDHLLHLFVDRGADGRVADVGVDLHQEVAADDHRLGFGVVDVGRDDGAPAGDLVAHRLGLDSLAQGDERHLVGDLAAAGIVHLGDAGTGAGAQRPALAREAQLGGSRIRFALATIRRARPLELFDVGAGADPGVPSRRQAGGEIRLEVRVAVGTAGVVDPQGRVGSTQRDLPHRHPHAVPFVDAVSYRTAGAHVLHRRAPRYVRCGMAVLGIPTLALPRSGSAVGRGSGSYDESRSCPLSPDGPELPRSPRYTASLARRGSPFQARGGARKSVSFESFRRRPVSRRYRGFRRRHESAIRCPDRVGFGPRRRKPCRD